ncbi:MAG: glucosamine-6-phosphate deaminase, partial [Calditrichia bacterium]
MRILIHEDYDRLSKWVANYVTDKINKSRPTKDKPFVLGLPTGSSPL